MTTQDEEAEQEITRLQALVRQEATKLQMLETSYSRVADTTKELESQMKGVSKERKEWKILYECQVEVNQQLTKQALLFDARLEEEKSQIAKIHEMPKEELFDLYMHRVDDQTIERLRRTKESLINRLHNFEMRLDHENKAYNRAVDEKKSKTEELNSIQQAIHNVRAHKDPVSMKHLLASYKQWQDEDKVQEAVKDSVNFQNIPPDRRILDTRMGPIRRTAAVKALPSLDTGRFYPT